MLHAIRSGQMMRRGVGWAILACALLLRVLVPQGWMPVATASGWQLTLCGGTGPMQMRMPMAQADADAHAHAMPAPGRHRAPMGEHDPGEHSCPYAGLAMALDRPEPSAITLPLSVFSGWIATAGRVVTIGHGLAAPPPPSTGPPLV